jgi:Salmonella virulence plasmid 65kDa B protein/Insecticide toxin TcdB middle/N-terminal region
VIPLEVTSARGLEPELALRCDSISGNGIFGNGANVALSSVARMNVLHLPTYDGADTFALDGAELVPVPGLQQTRTAGGRHFTIRYFRPRREGAFSRIERWEPDDGGAGFWRTLSRDDEIAVYGATADARVFDPDDPTRVFEWLIEARYDARGNAVRYRYKPEDDVGVSLSPSEQGRRHGANRYPQRISYGNLEPFRPVDPLDLPHRPWLFDVLFDYGEYYVSPNNDSPATPVKPWLCRRDSFSDYTAGFERRTHRLCRHVLMVHHFPTELGADDVVVRVMVLGYDDNPYSSRLTSIVSAGWWYVASRQSGHRYDVKALPAVRLAWSELPTSAPVFNPQAVAPGAALPSFGALPPYTLVDLDGSGLPGVLYADGATVAYTAPVLATADVGAPVVYQARPYQNFPIPRIDAGDAALVDLDGDGRLSLSWSTDALNGFFSRRQDGGWHSFQPFRQTLLETTPVATQFADLTGDGRSDRVCVDTNMLAYNRNLGRGGFAPLTRRPREHGLPLTSPPPPGEDVRFADVLGGGTTPAVLVRSGSLRCWPNLGYGHFAAPIDLAAPQWPNSVGPERVLLADLTGSGCADLVIALTDRLHVHRNRAGNGFDPDAIEIMLPAPLRSIAQLRSADMAGFGCQAFVFTSDEPAPRHWICDLAGGSRPGLIVGIDDSRGRVVKLGYASSARFQLLDRLEGRPWITTLTSPMPLVARVEQIDEVASVTRVIDYRYSHGYFDPLDRVFRGFGLVETRERDAPHPSQAQSVADAPPLLKREWYHTGAVLAAETLEEVFAREYWHGDGRAFPMPSSCFDWQGSSPDSETWREETVSTANCRRRCAPSPVSPTARTVP